MEGEVRVGDPAAQSVILLHPLPRVEVGVDVGLHACFGGAGLGRSALESEIGAELGPLGRPGLGLLGVGNVVALALCFARVVLRVVVVEKAEEDGLAGDHVGGAVVAFGGPALGAAREGAGGAEALDVGVEGEVDGEDGGEGVEVLVGDEADDDVGAGLAPGPGLGGGVGGEPVELVVVEEEVAGRAAEAGLVFGEGDVDVVCWVVGKKVAAVHLCAGLEDEELESGAQMVEGGGGAAEHGRGVFEFFLEVFVGLVCLGWVSVWGGVNRIACHTEIVYMCYLFHTSDFASDGIL